MRHFLLTAALLPAIALGGCLSTINSVNKTLGQVSGNDLTAACGIVAVAETYFANVSAKNTTSNLTAGQIAEKGAAAICNNPPTNIVQALVDLNTFWSTIQAATTVPAP